MRSLNRILLIVALMAIVWHIYQNGIQLINVGALVVLAASSWLEKWAAKKRKALDAQYRRDCEEAQRKSSERETIDIGGHVEKEDHQ